MDLFETLMTSRRLAFETGKITLADQRELMISARFFAEYQMAVNDSEEGFRKLYEAAKRSYREGTATTLGKNFAASQTDLLKWMANLATISGWGKTEVASYDPEHRRGIIVIEDLPIPELLKGKVKGCVDHVARGFIAGGASALLGSDVDCVEEECVAMGAPSCKFMFMPRDKFHVTPEVTRQLGIK